MSLTKPIADIGTRLCTAFSCWFVLPSQGMKDFEILNRGSAIVVPSRSPTFPYKYHVVTSSHIAAPWRWPGHYDEEYLKYICEKDTHYTVELRHADGSLMTQVECLPRTFHHPKRDLAILHLEDESNAMKVLDRLGFKPVKLHPRPDRLTVMCIRMYKRGNNSDTYSLFA